MPRRNTKEIILQEALKLFSQRGYDGVSVRDIAKEVGIRESALYKHYAGKQDIFDSLLKRMEEEYKKAILSIQLPQGSLAEDARQYEENGLEGLKRMCAALFLFFLKDEYARAFRRMLTMEQYRSDAVGETFRSYFIDSPLHYQEALFAEMIRQGHFRPADPKAMALQFYAPIFMLLSKCETSEEQEKAGLELLEKHIEQFEALYANPE